MESLFKIADGGELRNFLGLSVGQNINSRFLNQNGRCKCMLQSYGMKLSRVTLTAVPDNTNNLLGSAVSYELGHE